MSVGHIARGFEEAGIPTVIIATKAFRPRLEAMTLPRIILTPYPMGRPLGAPHDAAGQRKILTAALDLLANASKVGTILELDQPYSPNSMT
ncbi:MAG: hypothetical protein AAF490_00355 [Chloroflexota bacterium]